MTIPGLFLLSIPALLGAPPSSLQFVPTPNSTAQGVVPMPNGSIAVFGAANNNGCTANSPGSCDQTETPLFSILNASGNQTTALASSALGSGNSSIAGAAIDANGNFWITGTTDSDDFPLVHALYTQKTDYMQTGFVAKLDPNLNILFSTFLGGKPQLGKSAPVSIVLDSSGNAFVVGWTNDPNFPTTGPVFGVGAPSPSPANLPGRQVEEDYTFLVKISSDGSTLLFGRLLGGSGSHCLSFEDQCSGVTIPYAIAVGANGDLTVVGETQANGFPITASAYSGGSGAFVSRISADGSQLIWSTELGTSRINVPGPGGAFVDPGPANSVGVDAEDNVYLTGFAWSPIATTPGALQSQAQLETTEMQMGKQGNGFVVKLSSDATQLLFATNLTATVAGVTLDSAGNTWITGNTIYQTTDGKVNASNFPGLSNIPPTGLDFALELNSNATALQQIFSFLPPTATQTPAFDSNGNLLMLASAGNLVRLNTASALTVPAVFAITNSAIPQAAASVGVGELATVYGVGLGPATGISGEPDQNGLYPTQLGGVTVTMKGVAAPLLYVGPNQINLQVPFFGSSGPDTPLASGSIPIVVTTPTGPLPAMQTPLFSSLGIFGVVNEDGSINSASNPAPDGSIVALYLTGLGAPSSSTQNGAISQSANSAFLTDIEVKWPFVPLGVLYAGTAPDLINGLDQVNVQLPPGIKGLQLVVQTMPSSPAIDASVTSNPVTVYAQ